jgi:hypothetical protein
MSPAALCELRLLASARFDSQPLLCVVLAGDARLIDKLRREDLIPLGSRIRTRLATEHASREELIEGLAHLLTGAGNATLMTQQLRHTLCDHAAGNYRILTTMAAELLAVALALTEVDPGFAHRSWPIAGRNLCNAVCSGGALSGLAGGCCCEHDLPTAAVVRSSYATPARRRGQACGSGARA